MEKRKIWKYSLILLVVLLAAGVIFQPLYAAESQCGIWCSGCGKWQENFKGVKSGTEKNAEIALSCAECGRALISVSRWVETAHYSAGTENESSSWWRHFTVKRLDSAAEFPQALTELNGDSDSREDSYRVTADGDVFGTTGYGWTTREIHDEAEGYLEALFASLDDLVKNSSDGVFTWEKWYQHGLSIAQTGEKTSPLIAYLGRFGIQALLQEEMIPPILSVTGEAEVRLYRDGTLTADAVKAGDRVEIVPVKRPGREYSEYAMEGTAGDIVWDEGERKLCFTMPSEDVSIELFYKEVQRLEVELNAAFYERYQKEPYWDGVSFNLDCQPAITVEKELLTVKAVLVHSKTGETETRLLTDFSIEGDNRIINLGENAINVKADALGDGYELRGECILKADSVSLKELMESTGSETYTELKAFVMGLTAKLAEYEKLIEELSKNLAMSEEKRVEAERLLAEALAELENVNARLNLAKEQLAAMSAELADKSEQLAVSKEQLALSKEQLAMTEERLAAATGELAGMKEKLTAMQGFMQEVMGSEQIDEETLEKLKDKFEELSQQREALTEELGKLKDESGDLLAQNKELSTQNGELGKDKEKLEREIERLRSYNDEFAEQLKYTLDEQKVLLSEYGLLKEKYDNLIGERAEKEEEYQEKLAQLQEKLAQLETEKEKLTTKLTEVNTLLETEREHSTNLEAEVRQAQQIKQEQPIKQERESATVIRLETVTETQTEKQTGKTAETATEAMETMTAAETATTEELMPETMTESEKLTFTQQYGAKTSGMRLGSETGRSVLQGIVIVILSMLLGGFVLYVTLNQKEKEADIA